MNIDTNFVVEIYTRYTKHLLDVVDSIKRNVKQYERQEEELIRLVEYKPQTYQKALDEVREKIRQADIKLSHLIPRLEKMSEQIEIINKNNEQD